MTASGVGAPTVYVVPHTHWDREWYDSEARFRQRLVPTVDAVLDGLETGDLPVFLLDGQTVLIEDYLAVRPEERRRVERLARAGRLLLGPWYILADEQLPADETLVRNLLAGRRTGDRLGSWLPLGYSPDAFGHPAALPSILAGFGVRSAILWRGYGGEPGEEADLFHWIGPDGARVLVHHLPPDGYELGANLPETRGAWRRRWARIREQLGSRAADRPLLLLNGADHHRPQRTLQRVLQRLEHWQPECRFVAASPLEYFAALPESPTVPAVEGELRFSSRHAWTLQGVLATRAGLKAAIAEGERLLLRWAEPQAALAWAAGGPDPRRLLITAWREHLRNTFHDTLAGTVADPVAREARVRAERVAIQARGMMHDALAGRLRQDPAAVRRYMDRARPTLVVVNPSAADRSGIVEATLTVFRGRVVVGGPGRDESDRPRPSALWVLDRRGMRMPVQILGAYRGYERFDSPEEHPREDRVSAVRVAVAADDVPGLGTRAFDVETTGGRRGRRARPSPRVVVRGTTIRGGGLEVAGRRRRGFSAFQGARGRRLPVVGELVSERDGGDTYTFEPVAGDEPRVARWARPRVVAAGPLIAALARDFRIPRRAHGTVYVRLDAGSPLIRLAIDGENVSGGHRLRVRFALPEGATPDRVVADMPYGPVSRFRESYDLRAFPSEWPIAAAPMQRWVSVPGGVTLFARDRYEYEVTEAGDLMVTLLRAVGELSRGNLAARLGHAAWPTPTPGAEERGRFRAELALAFATVDPAEPAARLGTRLSYVERLSEEFHAPLAGCMLRYGLEVPDRVQGVTLEGDGLVLKGVKPAEVGDALVLRCLNVTAERLRGVWTCPFRIRRATLVRLDETEREPLPIVGGGRQVVFDARGREVVSLRVEW